MSSRDVRVLTDDDPTVEEEAPDFDSSHTDQIERPTFVSTRDHGPGAIEHDERGQARWKWATEHEPPSSEAEKTFDHLEALSNDRLALEDAPAAAAAPTPGPQPGYDPYDTNSPRPSQPPRKHR